MASSGAVCRGAKAVAQIIDQQPNIDPESLPIVQELREEIAELKKLCDKLEEAERAVAHLTPDWIKKLKPGDKVLSSTPQYIYSHIANPDSEERQ